MSEQAKTIKNRPKVCPTGWCDCFSCRYRQSDNCIYGEQDELLLTEIAEYLAKHLGYSGLISLPKERRGRFYNEARELLAKVKQHYEQLIPNVAGCPFCNDNEDYDLIGLKYHLNNYCQEYQNTEVIGR